MPRLAEEQSGRRSIGSMRHSRFADLVTATATTVLPTGVSATLEGSWIQVL